MALVLIFFFPFSFFFPFCVGGSWGGLIAIGLLAAGGGCAGGFVVGGVGDGPLPPGLDPGAASQALSASFLDLITFNPSKIFADTSFCFTSVTVQAMCL
jgi:pimeloyl-ACP methyl ester carboxylesterase